MTSETAINFGDVRCELDLRLRRGGWGGGEGRRQMEKRLSCLSDIYHGRERERKKKEKAESGRSAMYLSFRVYLGLLISLSLSSFLSSPSSW